MSNATATITGPPRGPRTPRVGDFVALHVPWSKRPQRAKVTAVHDGARLDAEYLDSLRQVRQFRSVPRLWGDDDPRRPAWVPRGV